MISSPDAAPRSCPFCDGVAGAAAFPFASRYAGEVYAYRSCRTCGTRFIDPLPRADVFAQIYAPVSYHDQYYDGEGQGDYEATAALLAKHLPLGAKVLDYGCGAGHLITALRNHGFTPSGAEFSADAARNAAERTSCPVHDLSEPHWPYQESWDCVHFGDVIEHLPEPKVLLNTALERLRPGGYLSATGPLEANRSLVNGAAAIVGRAKRLYRPHTVAEFPPYHLLFTSAAAQRSLFSRLDTPLQEVVWKVSETGWPYRHNGALRNAVAIIAIGLSKLPGARLGNRFHALYQKAA